MSVRAIALDAVLRRVISADPLDVTQEIGRRRAEGTPVPAEVPAAVRRRLRVDEGVVQNSRVVSLRHGSPCGRSVIFLAGGGYAHPITKAHWSAAARFAQLSRLDLIVPLYEVVPTGDAVRAHALLDQVLSNECEKRGEGNVFLMGDSAGAGLALSVLQRHASRIAGAVLLNPWLDVEVSHPAVEAMQRWDVILHPNELRKWGREWAGEFKPSDPRVSPLNGPFVDLPPVHIITGGRDLLLPDALEAHRRLRAAKNTGTLTYEPDGNHALGLMGSSTPEGARALQAIISALRA
jgi:monoterpene epsilon-lactone hydrolase